MSFPCSQCGLCCKSLDNSSIYDDLNRGDGICVHFDEQSNMCSIYEERPLKCKIDAMYQHHFYKFYSLKEYYALNEAACNELKKKET
ncbi:YkgJ family cysteine cluster protein [Exiguobacterium sp. s46]|uniref:YkgJ family cysteine cluster protein n=1 Tax=Exiguobacterium TaxID=33986 RepID=UPI001BECEFA4